MARFVERRKRVSRVDPNSIVRDSFKPNNTALQLAEAGIKVAEKYQMSNDERAKIKSQDLINEFEMKYNTAFGDKNLYGDKERKFSTYNTYEKDLDKLNKDLSDISMSNNLFEKVSRYSQSVAQGLQYKYKDGENKQQYIDDNSSWATSLTKFNAQKKSFLMEGTPEALAQADKRQEQIDELTQYGVDRGFVDEGDAIFDTTKQFADDVYNYEIMATINEVKRNPDLAGDPAGRLEALNTVMNELRTTAIDRATVYSNGSKFVDGDILGAMLEEKMKKLEGELDDDEFTLLEQQRENEAKEFKKAYDKVRKEARGYLEELDKKQIADNNSFLTATRDGDVVKALSIVQGDKFDPSLVKTKGDILNSYMLSAEVGVDFPALHDKSDGYYVPIYTTGQIAGIKGRYKAGDIQGALDDVWNLGKQYIPEGSSTPFLKDVASRAGIPYGILYAKQDLENEVIDVNEYNEYMGQIQIEESANNIGENMGKNIIYKDKKGNPNDASLAKLQNIWGDPSQVITSAHYFSPNSSMISIDAYEAGYDRRQANTLRENRRQSSSALENVRGFFQREQPETAETALYVHPEEVLRYVNANGLAYSDEEISDFMDDFEDQIRTNPHMYEDLILANYVKRGGDTSFNVSLSDMSVEDVQSAKQQLFGRMLGTANRYSDYDAQTSYKGLIDTERPLRTINDNYVAKRTEAQEKASQSLTDYSKSKVTGKGTLLDETLHYEPQQESTDELSGETIYTSHPAGNTFTSEVIPLVNVTAKKYGLDPALMMAQIIQESGWEGKQSGDYNYAGIKTGSKWKGRRKKVATTEVGNTTQGLNLSGGELVDNGDGTYSTVDEFRSYDSPAQGIDAYGRFLKTFLQKHGGSLEKWATDPNYVQRIETLREQFNQGFIN